MSLRSWRRSVAVVAALLMVGCGGSASAGAKDPLGHDGQPIVFAAASLTKAFPRIDPRATYSFGGSGTLETQIEQGAPADVFAAASPAQTTALYADGLVDKPVEFATNSLVLVVPRSNPAHITSVTDVTRPGVKLVICNPTVPCGGYARNVFTNLGITAAAMRNVVSQTTDVTTTLADVASGQADAGFVYVTDADAAHDAVTAIRLPAKANPGSQDWIAVVRSGNHQAAAAAFVAAVTSPAGQATLRAAGFGAP